MKKAMLLGCLLISCGVHAESWETSNPFDGVTYNKIRIDRGKYELAMDCLEIDLGNERISFTTTKGTDNPNWIDQTMPETTMDFMKRTETQIAVNGMYYSWDPYYHPIGKAYSEGEDVVEECANNWEFNKWWPSIDISKTNEISLLLDKKSQDAHDKWNTFTGSDLIVKDGKYNPAADGEWNVPHQDEYRPSTMIGFNESENKLIVMTIDGRQNGWSDGATFEQTANWMIKFGADWAVNMDGGGSTQMTMDDGQSRYVNRPSEKYRAVAHNIGVFADVNETFRSLANFEHGNRGTFTSEPATSGTNKNVSDASTAETITDDAAVGEGAMKLRIVESNKGDDWELRFLSANGRYSQNIKRETSGFIGVWAKTADEGQFISIALDDSKSQEVEMEYGVKQEMIADDEWHYYEWAVDDAAQWLAYTESSNGEIDGATMSIDSVLLYGEKDSVVYLDEVVHDSEKSMTIPEPTALAVMGIGGIAAMQRRR
ncbi:phosphodiester glycosidase family protein [Planctomycetota bacterium]|nr:phosphodiester glycosidase family protein [Planctomycetota bacterium]